MKVKLQIYFKAQDGKTYKQVIKYVNPNASDEVLKKFVGELNELTTNDLKSVMKIVNTYLDEESLREGVTQADIDAILSEMYVNVFDEDGVTQVDIDAIIDETYEPIDDDGITQSDIDAILSTW